MLPSTPPLQRRPPHVTTSVPASRPALQGPAYGFPDIVDRASGGAVNPAGWASEERRLPRGADGPLCHLLAPWCPHRVAHTLLLAASGPCTARTCGLHHVTMVLSRLS